ncbi:MAG: hypothetical protein ABJE95_14935 [Byssovorax sp.]
MFRSFGAAAVLVITSMAVLGCGSSLSLEDATIRCDQEKAAKGMLFGRTTYQECLSCYQICGNECSSVATSPPTYMCSDPVDQIELEASKSSTSSK